MNKVALFFNLSLLVSQINQICLSNPISNTQNLQPIKNLENLMSNNKEYKNNLALLLNIWLIQYLSNLNQSTPTSQINNNPRDYLKNIQQQIGSLNFKDHNQHEHIHNIINDLHLATINILRAVRIRVEQNNHAEKIRSMLFHIFKLLGMDTEINLNNNVITIDRVDFLLEHMDPTDNSNPPNNEDFDLNEHPEHLKHRVFMFYNCLVLSHALILDLYNFLTTKENTSIKHPMGTLLQDKLFLTIPYFFNLNETENEGFLQIPLNFNHQSNSFLSHVHSMIHGNIILTEIKKSNAETQKTMQKLNTFKKHINLILKSLNPNNASFYLDVNSFYNNITQNHNLKHQT